MFTIIVVPCRVYLALPNNLKYFRFDSSMVSMVLILMLTMDLNTCGSRGVEFESRVGSSIVIAKYRECTCLYASTCALYNYLLRRRLVSLNI